MAVPCLDARLRTAAALARPGEGVADIGCDHGKLTAVFAASGLYPKVIGADLRPGPLSRARETLARANLSEKAELRLGDGLSVLRAGEVGTIVIAGVSAQTIIGMLAAAPWIFENNGPRLVLVPATKHAVLRAWLFENGFSLVRDVPVEAAGRWYAVIAAEPGAAPRAPETLAAAECLYGKTAAEPGAAAYAAHERGKLAKYRIGLDPQSAEARAIDALLAADKT